MPARVIGKARAVLRRSARHEVLAPNSSWRAPAILYGRNLSDEPGSEISRSSRRETPALRGDHLFDALQCWIGTVSSIEGLPLRADPMLQRDCNLMHQID